MKVILEGEERLVKTIIKENRVRVSRGQVSFSPADSISTPEGVTEEDVKNMVEAIGQRDARIEELMQENETLKATLEEKANEDAPEAPDTQGDGEENDGEGDDTDTKEGEETDTTEAPEEGDKKDAPEAPDTKEVEEVPDTKGKKSSKK